MPKKYYYPAIFEEDTELGGYGVYVPDLPGCITQGETIEECNDMLQEAIGLILDDYDMNDYPVPSNPADIHLDANQFIAIVPFDKEAYDKKYHSKSVKKTLSIPEWLNEQALAKNINFSNVLQNALVRELGLA